MAESRIVNEPRSKNPLAKAIRELLEHRALWLYLLTDEAAKAGADPAAFAPAAVKRCGLFQGAELVAKGGGTNSLKSLKKFTEILLINVIDVYRIVISRYYLTEKQ